MKINYMIKKMLAGLLCATSLAYADTVLIDFGGGSGGHGTNTYSNGWNQAKLEHITVPIVGTDTGVVVPGTQTINNVRTTTNTASGLTITVDPPGLLLVGPGTLVETSLGVNTDIYDAAAPLWQQLYGSSLSMNAVQSAWATGSVASIEGAQSITIGGLSAGTYTMSGIFNVAQLAGVLDVDNLPVLFSGAGVTSSKGYMTSIDGSIIDLSLLTVDLLNVIGGGTFMMSWEFELDSKSDISLTFNSSLIDLLSGTSISSLAIGDGYRITPLLPEGPTIPEPGASVLGLMGTVAFFVRRRRKG